MSLKKLFLKKLRNQSVRDQISQFSRHKHVLHQLHLKWLDFTFDVHNGAIHVICYRIYAVGHRLGEFSPHLKFQGHSKKKVRSRSQAEQLVELIKNNLL